MMSCKRADVDGKNIVRRYQHESFQVLLLLTVVLEEICCSEIFFMGAGVGVTFTGTLHSNIFSSDPQFHMKTSASTKDALLALSAKSIVPDACFCWFMIVFKAKPRDELCIVRFEC